MDPKAIIGRRMHNLGLWGAAQSSPLEVVARLGALQGQEFGYVRWSIGQRSKADDADIRALFDAGEILRTHLLRPTWHLVAAADIRWLLKVTARRVHALNAHRYRELGLGDKEFKRCEGVLAKELAGGVHLTRREIGALLESSRVDVSGQRIAYLMMHAELEELICSGAIRGKQQTYALLDERAPDAIDLDMEAALQELTRRYFMTRGPATVKDMARWSSMTMAECKRGIEMLEGELEELIVDNRTYWLAPGASPRRPPSPRLDLIQVYDEYVMSYSESRDVLGGKILTRESPYMHVVLLDGQLIGYWKRTEKGNEVTLEVDFLRSLKRPEKDAFEVAVDRFSRFLEREPVLDMKP